MPDDDGSTTPLIDDLARHCGSLFMSFVVASIEVRRPTLAVRTNAPGQPWMLTPAMPELGLPALPKVIDTLGEVICGQDLVANAAVLIQHTDTTWTHGDGTTELNGATLLALDFNTELREWRHVNATHTAILDEGKIVPTRTTELMTWVIGYVQGATERHAPHVARRLATRLS